VAQVRYRQVAEPCEVEARDDGSLRVAFKRPQRAVTPGQSVVLYDGEHCLGGAVIAATDAPLESRHAA
jgi:tRNA-specific 2-thiouridylase